MPSGWHDHPDHDLRRGDIVEWTGPPMDEGSSGVLLPGDRGRVTLVEPEGDVVVNFGPEKPDIDVETCPSSVKRVAG